MPTAAAKGYAESFAYDDRRRLSGDPIEENRAGVQAVQERILDRLHAIRRANVAVRGERLQLFWTRWSNDAGYETTYLIVHEVDDSGRVAYEGRFDGDDFEGAYRELERRYYAGEGAPFAEAGAIATELLMALNRGEFDRVFGELSTPGMRVENLSRSAFPDRSAGELRTTTEALNAMVASARVWGSAVCWFSPTCCVSRSEREAVGRDGELYEWTWLLVCEFHEGRLASLCEFELDDEAAAFAYAEERVRATDTD